jgi:hypothetical protein
MRLVGEFTRGETARWAVGYRDMSGEPALLEATTQALVVQLAGPNGSWRTRSSFVPHAGALGVRSLQASGRVIFPAGASVEAIELEPRGFACNAAEHSRLGDLIDPTGPLNSAELEVGDTLEVAYQPATASESGEDCFLRVLIPGTSQATNAAPRARAPIETDVPAEFALQLARPNPFSRSTSIHFDLPRASSVRIELFDVQGRRVAVLANHSESAGRHSVSWSGQTEGGLRAKAGIYLCRMTAGSFTAERRVTLLP